MGSNWSAWNALVSKLCVGRKKHSGSDGNNRYRALRFEQCEDRHMLATFVVTNNGDAPAGTPAAIGSEVKGTGVKSPPVRLR
jgi:hypothetical protein